MSSEKYKINVGAVNIAQKHPITQGELQRLKDRLKPGKAIWITETDEDGNDNGYMVTVMQTYKHVVLLNCSISPKYIGSITERRISCSYIQLLLMLGRERYAER